MFFPDVSWSTSLHTVASRLGRFSRKPTLIPTTCTTLSPLKLCTRPPRLTCLRRLSPTPTPPPRTVGPIPKRRLPLCLVLEVSCLCGLLFSFFLYLFLVGSVQGLFSCFSISLRFREVSHVEGSSLTTSLRYQTFAFYEISKPKVD